MITALFTAGYIKPSAAEEMFDILRSRRLELIKKIEIKGEKIEK